MKIEQTEDMFDDKWTSIISKLPTGGDYRFDQRKCSYNIIADYIGTGKNVFDYACGLSVLGRIIKSRGNRVCGCDFSKVAIDYAKRTVSEGFYQSDQIYGQHDYIVASQFIEHIDNPVQWINEAFQNTEKLIVSIPNNFHVVGEHHLMQWNSWESFYKLFKDFDMIRVDTPEMYSSIHPAWAAPIFEVVRK
jgi:2-polyprenyl-3-methyl-5-hydroxy-6-metoxy-1,4-benzoquinol methylase